MFCINALAPLSASKGSNSQKVLDGKVDDLHPAEDGEAGEEPHGASDEPQGRLRGHFLVLQDIVIGGGGEVDEDVLELVVGHPQLWGARSVPEHPPALPLSPSNLMFLATLLLYISYSFTTSFSLGSVSMQNF